MDVQLNGRITRTKSCRRSPSNSPAQRIISGLIRKSISEPSSNSDRWFRDRQRKHGGFSVKKVMRLSRRHSMESVGNITTNSTRLAVGRLRRALSEDSVTDWLTSKVSSEDQQSSRVSSRLSLELEVSNSCISSEPSTTEGNGCDIEKCASTESIEEKPVITITAEPAAPPINKISDIHVLDALKVKTCILKKSILQNTNRNMKAYVDWEESSGKQTVGLLAIASQRWKNCSSQEIF